MTNRVYIATSIDGFIADRHGEIDWLMSIPNPDGSDYGFAEFMNGVDAVVMGRNTFEQVLKFGEWPYSKKVFVLSRKIRVVPEHLRPKVEIISGNPSHVVNSLTTRGYEHLYIDGGNVIQQFLRANLIDELIVTRISVVLGGGIPLFSETDQTLHFTLISAEMLNEFMVKESYVRIR